LLYTLLKPYTRLAIKIFCRHIVITNKAMLQSKGPLLLAANHPNSFLDAVIINTLFNEPVYSLARGDSFKNKHIAALLRKLRILPVYREREGKQNLHRNYDTFDECQQIFKRNGIVLIFIEALCENEWHLRPLKKGTARVAVTAWQQGLPLKVVPVGINYSSFYLFGKNVHLHLGEPVCRQQLTSELSDNGKIQLELTSILQSDLKKMVYEIEQQDKERQKQVFSKPVPVAKKIALALPAAAGAVLHAPLYLPVQQLVKYKAKNSVHYDSIITGLLFILYPLYVLLWAILAGVIVNGWAVGITFFLMPFFAWSFVQLKHQTDR
jgi:1-acyl-sn-glycerol-3-phosphate acyltransferase